MSITPRGPAVNLNQRGSEMAIQDVGPQPQAFDLEQATRENENYRTVAWSGRYFQVTLMSIPSITVL